MWFCMWSLLNLRKHSWGIFPPTNFLICEGKTSFMKVVNIWVIFQSLFYKWCRNLVQLQEKLKYFVCRTLHASCMEIQHPLGSWEGWRNRFWFCGGRVLSTWQHAGKFWRECASSQLTLWRMWFLPVTVNLWRMCFLPVTVNLWRMCFLPVTVNLWRMCFLPVTVNLWRMCFLPVNPLQNVLPSS